ncbi:hypothetical protein I4U23_007361 [Adineta vaga]|nr:hypothetical protein I4U23_007361 [Adineta vaga]
MSTNTTTIEQTNNHVEKKHTESSVLVAEQPLTLNSVPSVGKISSNDITNSIGTEGNNLIYKDLTRLKPTKTSKLPLPVKNVKSSLRSLLFGSTFVLVVTGIVSLVPILQLIVGRRYADECPMNWYIPHYLLVAGIAGLSTILLAIIFVLSVLYVTSQLKAKDVRTPSLPVSCGLCGMFLVLICFLVFLCGWFITGCIWVFRVWTEVQYTYAYRTDYCNPILYRFAYGLLLTSIVSYVFACVIACRQGRKLFIISRHDSSLRVPTIEL